MSFHLYGGPLAPLKVGDRVLGTFYGRQMTFEVTAIETLPDGTEETTLEPVKETD